MDEILNPYAPGAGVQPPQLAGREEILEAARVALGRTAQNKSSQGIILTGLRGVGKTVLLNRIQQMAEEAGLEVDLIEAPESAKLVELLFPSLKKMLVRMSRSERAKEVLSKALRVLKSLQISASVADTEFTLGLQPEPGVADSGELERDLPDLVQAVGEVAKEHKKGIVILIDELQYLSARDYGALIVSLHRAAQRGLPIVFTGAGLPTLPGLSGNAKSYAERLFTYPKLGQLSQDEARKALQSPLTPFELVYTEDAMQIILENTKCYPYFLQEWGYACWNAADSNEIGKETVTEATKKAVKKLDGSFFRVRLERLSSAEKTYLRALAEFGPGSHSTGDLSELLGKKPGQLAKRRESLIQKGMIFQPSYGKQEFTVPLFDEFMRREMTLT
jgi:hypothetical protein